VVRPRLHPLDRKLLRDVWRMRLHAVAIALVLACGLSVLIMAAGMRTSLDQTRRDYYAAYRMMDLSAGLVRAPDRVAGVLAALPGVRAVETRVSGLALLDIPGQVEPASAHLVSLPLVGRPRVNDLAMTRGHWPDPKRPDEVVVSEAFANALGLQPGASLSAVVHGRQRNLQVVGVANAPEFIFVAAPGELFPQPGRFGVIWMGRDSLAQAFDLEGAFNDVAFRLDVGLDPTRTIRAIDAALAPYGSGGAFGRDRMMSDRFLSEELRQLSTMAVFLPAIFLLVAAFLVNIALGRMIATERSNIGLLKAFGYGDLAVAVHYAKSALVIGIAGALLGTGAGLMLGRRVADLYQAYYHFPTLEFTVGSLTLAGAWVAALLAVGAGAAVAVRQAVRLPPAEALAPPLPAAYRQSPGWQAAFADRLDAKSRIILRRILRFPRRALSTLAGIALAIALLVVSGTFPAVMDRLLSVQFGIANRQDATLTFAQPLGMNSLHEAERLPGVLAAEPFRAEEMRFRKGGREVREVVIGLPFDARLSRPVDREGQAVDPPATGLALSRGLARRLDAQPGDTIEVLQVSGRQIQEKVRVSRIVDPMVGSAAYMNLETLGRLVREPDRISGVQLRLDPALHADFNARLKNIPALAGVSFVRQAEISMRRAYEEGVGVMTSIYLVFAAIMAGGVAFSASRVTLAEQERDLATLRVLGFTRAEASYILMGELVVLALVAIAPGCLMGTGLGILLMRLFQTDMYSFDFVFSLGGYGFAITFTLLCVGIAGLIVRTGVDRLDLVAVLKARD
jgi:putative ABC transport system permease protein